MNISNSINYGLQLYLQKEDEQSWQKINTLFDTFSPTTQDQKLQILTKLNPLIVRSMLSDRSRLSGTSLNLISKCKDCTFNFDIFIEPLFKLINRPNKVFSTRSEAVLLELMDKFKNKLFYKAYLKSVNKNVRHCAYKAAEIIMDDIEVFREGVKDAHPECRIICKRVLMAKGEMMEKKQKDVSVGFFSSMNNRAKEVVKKCISQFSPFKKQQKIVEREPIIASTLTFEKEKVSTSETIKLKSKNELQKNEQVPIKNEANSGCFTPTKIQEYINKYKTKGNLASKYLSKENAEEMKLQSTVSENQTLIENAKVDTNNEKLKNEEESISNTAFCEKTLKTVESKKECLEVKQEQNKNVEGVLHEKLVMPLSRFDMETNNNNEAATSYGDQKLENAEIHDKEVLHNTPHFETQMHSQLLKADTNNISLEDDTKQSAHEEAYNHNNEDKTLNKRNDSAVASSIENINLHEKKNETEIKTDENTSKISVTEKKDEISLIFCNDQQCTVSDELRGLVQPGGASSISQPNCSNASTSFVREMECDYSLVQESSDFEAQRQNRSAISCINHSVGFNATSHDLSQANMPSFHENTVNTSLSKLSLNENMSLSKSMVVDEKDDDKGNDDIDNNEYTLVDDAYIRRKNIEKRNE